MEAFQKFILFGAIILLIITLVFIGISLSKTKADQQWPPIIPECPDYWTIDGSGNNASCINTKNLGTCKPPAGSRFLTMKFNTPEFSGTRASCAKYTWARKCGVSWDGITYGVNNPCQKTT
jgi:hypothetical protein